MPRPDMSKKINIFHIVEFVLAVLAAFCMADSECIRCDKHVIQMQLVSATAFGFLIVTSVIFFGMFFEEKVGEKSDLCYSALGGIMSVCSGIIVLIFVTDEDYGLDNYNYYKLVISGTALLINGIIFIVEFFLLIFKKKVLE